MVGVMYRRGKEVKLPSGKDGSGTEESQDMPTATSSATHSVYLQEQEGLMFVPLYRQL